MNYFDLYSSYPDQTTVAAWDSQLAEAAQTPGLAEILLPRGSELFSRFAASYAELRALPRSARRALQRRIARSSELAAILPEYLQQGGRRLQHRMAWTLAGAALLLALGQGVATAATITVTTNNPNAVADGQCSLIEAIVNANNDAATHADCPAGSGADTIVLPVNAKLVLRSAHNQANGPTGLPAISTPITIQGNGAEIVRRAIPRFRLMAVNNSGDLTLKDLTLSNGNVTRRIRRRGGTTYDSFGGALLNLGVLTIQNSTISGNRADNGGGVASTQNGTLSIENSTISGNSVNSRGGGVDNFGDLIVQSSTISGNSAQWIGGGLYDSGSSTTINDSAVSNNTAFFGGGLFNSGTLAIGNGTVSGNDARYSGGGIFNGNHYASVGIEDSIISGNHAAVGWGGGIFNYGAVDVAGSTISDNSASRGGGAFNSWSYFSPNTLSITNSTISGNEASDDGGGIFNYRSGCYYYCYFGGYLSLVGSTITQNRAGDSGGGLFNEGTLNMTNSAISNNQAPVGPDIFP